MVTPLAQRMTVNSSLFSRFTELMRASEGRYRLISVMCIGCGDVFISRYFPKLEMLVNTGLVKLMIADKEPFEELVTSKLALAASSNELDSLERLRKRYATVQYMMQHHPNDIAYLNLSDEKDFASYMRLTQDMVFVLCPDDAHIQCAQDWIGRATVVFIEKPYACNLVEAQCFEETLYRMITTNGEDLPYTIVICLDHYLAKIFDYLMHRKEVASYIGAVREIEFSICESGGVEAWRVPALQAGMIYDLFSHVLAQISPFVNLDSFFPNNGTSAILAAQHEQCPIPSESFASIVNSDLRDTHDRKISIQGTIGKGIGVQDCKVLTIRGDHKTLTADFGPKADGKLYIECSGEALPHYTIGKGHDEILDAIFNGKYMREPVGGLLGADALKILKILTHMRTKVETRKSVFAQKQYPLGTPVEDIMQHFAVRVM